MALPKFISRNTFARRALTACLAVVLSACGARSSTPAPEAVFTSAAQTAAARSTEMFAQTPTVDPASMVATIAAPTPAETEAVTAAPAAGGQGTPAGASAAPTTAATQAAPPASTGGDAAVYVADVNVPDGTTFAPGETFEKTWRIQNSGATTWGVAYSLVFIDGNALGAETRIPLPNEVDPGEQVEITVPMVAPDKPGSYTSYWKMTNASGTLFGFGASGTEAIWVKISVSGSSEATPESSLPTGPAPVVSAAQLTVDNAASVGPCPYTFSFNGQITLTKAATVTYVLEASTSAGVMVRTPLPITRNLSEGVHPISYQLTVGESFDGWARLHVTAPVELTSDPVAFSLSCG